MRFRAIRCAAAAAAAKHHHHACPQSLWLCEIRGIHPKCCHWSVAAPTSVEERAAQSADRPSECTHLQARTLTHTQTHTHIHIYCRCGSAPLSTRHKSVPARVLVCVCALAPASSTSSSSSSSSRARWRRRRWWRCHAYTHAYGEIVRAIVRCVCVVVGGVSRYDGLASSIVPP